MTVGGSVNRKEEIAGGMKQFILAAFTFFHFQEAIVVDIVVK